jgi:hypothetical protein
MTYVGPYTQATLIPSEAVFEPEIDTQRHVSTPGTILDYISKYHPYFLDMIKKANLMSLYNTVNRMKYTVFIPCCVRSFFNPLYVTVTGVITTDMMLSSPNMIIYTNNNDAADDHQLIINSDASLQKIFVNDSQIVYGDIQCTNGIVHVLKT